MTSFGDTHLDHLAESVIPSEHFEFDPELLRDSIFSTDRMLVVKQRIFEQYRVSGTPLADHLLSCLQLEGDEALLDLGCGNGVQLEMVGRLLPNGRIVGQDIARGVLDAAHARLAGLGLDCELIESSADNLTMFATDSFDRVMANYMLHYVPYLSRCIADVRRILRPGGRFVVTTNSTRSMVEMYDLHFEALRRVGAPDQLFKASPKGRISLENGEGLLSAHFERVELRRRPDVLEFETVDPFLEFYAVGHNYCSAASRPDPLLDEAFFARLLGEMRSLAEETISTVGKLTITKLTGSFVCR
ncbi:methyltransferase domain-containing protein [Nocardia abscessus]|uniref:Methyltransferase domain-containing protein n=1 Tax=Nocardia abscessus TaxID=120957 RepID=A0ABS0CDW0_9NOCA|nr:class I SAM-dependent methyltransferase [Nocardia abscessus]MBF6228511.1 methyltransferase domain-containing protein [Nocardia abscessus]